MYSMIFVAIFIEKYMYGHIPKNMLINKNIYKNIMFFKIKIICSSKHNLGSSGTSKKSHKSGPLNQITR